MRTLIVSDIFGKTSSLKTLAETIGETAEIIDPYAGAEISFADEAEAYACFMNNVGLERYCQIVHRHVTPISQPAEIIGFSIGASAVWMVSEMLSPSVFQRVVCFYGSQIRYHMNINPCVGVELVMPRLEPTFDVGKLSRELANKPGITVHRTQYLHGFMNHLSNNFSATGYETYIAWLKNQSPRGSSGSEQALGR